jgi:hypothetical protein
LCCIIIRLLCCIVIRLLCCCKIRSLIRPYKADLKMSGKKIIIARDDGGIRDVID